jgi:hypothetical protein
MQAFESHDSLAQSFVRAYYTICVYRNRLIHKFYDPAAVITRGVRSLVFNVTQSQDLILPLPDNSVFTVLSHTVVPAGSSFLVCVAGLIEANDAKYGFSQHFVLSERNTKVWIVADVLTVFNDEYLMSPREADSYLVPPVKRTQPQSRPPRAEREPKPKPESKTDPKADPNPDAKPEAKADAKPDPKQRPKPRRPEDDTGEPRREPKGDAKLGPKGEREAKEGGQKRKRGGGLRGKSRDGRRGQGKKSEDDRFEWVPNKDAGKDGTA